MAKHFCLLMVAFLPFLAVAQTDTLVLTPLGDTSIAHLPVKEEKEVSLGELDMHAGEEVTFCATVVGARQLKKVKGKPVLMKLQGSRQDEKANVQFVLNNPEALKKRVDKFFKNKRLCFTGTPGKQDNATTFILDNVNTQKLMLMATIAPTVAVKPEALATQPLQTNAYLLAGPDLSEAIITHLKKGSVVHPFYKKGKWVYVQVISKAGSNEQPASLNGFIRAASLNLKQKQKNVKL